MNKILISLAVALTTILTACGGSTNEDGTPTALSITVLGNSFAVQGPNSNVGWNHTSGMAASDADHDYAHLIAANMQMKLDVQNVGDIERDPVGTSFVVIPKATDGLTARTVVVVQLGDELNETYRNEFNAAYTRLLDGTVGTESLVCISTWWADASTDSMISAACAQHGGHYVYIGDIYPQRTDVTTGESTAIASRPHDPSMAIIAQRIGMALSH